MNLPISWVAAAANPASRLAKQTASLAVNSASHFFGDLLQYAQPSINGHLEQAPTTRNQVPSNLSKSWSERLESLRPQLSTLIAQSRMKFGIPPNIAADGSFSIISNGSEPPTVIGPEPIRADLEQQLMANPALSSEITTLAKTKPEPLNLLQNRTTQSNSKDPLRIWID